MQSSKIDIFVGVLLVLGFASLCWLALQLGEVSWLTGSTSYTLQAEFGNISGVKSGSDIQIAGVKIGTVRKLELNEEGLAIATLQVDNTIEIPVDSIASVKSQGLIGDKFIQVSLGGDEEVHKNGDTIYETESSVDLESLISKFAFGQVK